MKKLQQQIIEWAKAKGIDNPGNQKLKVIEEAGEVAGAILKGNRDEILMEIGDVAVTIIILHRLTGVESLIDVQYIGEVEANDPTESLMWIMRLCEYSIATKEVDNLAAQFDSTLEECLTMAWNKIKAYNKADEKGKELISDLFPDFDPNPITKRIRNFEDVLEVLGIGQGEWYTRIKDLEADEVVYIQLKLIAKAYNQGWEPDWEDETQDKCFPWFYTEDLVENEGPAAVHSSNAPSLAYAHIGSRLAFSCEDHALDAGRKFYELYRKFSIGK